MEEIKQKELQERYMEMQMLEQQIRQIQQQIQMLESQLMELTATNQGLDDFEKTSIGTDILVPLSPGIFTKATLKDNKDVIVNVGANVAVKKDIKSTKELIDKQAAEIKRFQEEMLVELQMLGAKAGSIEQEINNAITERGQ